MYVVDASVWVSSLFQTDVTHEASLRWLQGTVQRREFIFAPALLLPEVGGAIARRSGVPAVGIQALDRLQGFLSLRTVPLDLELAQKSARLAANLRLRGADAVNVALARRLGMPLVTWDGEQRERARSAVRVIRTMTPTEALRG